MKPMKPMEPMQPMAATTGAERWWPEDLGEPSSTGAADDARYAYFASKHRLALDEGGKVRLFDTGPKRIEGFAQSQRPSGSLRFASDGCTVGLDALYAEVAARLPHHVFSDRCTTPVVRNRHGDSSGVRGAAWLWPAR